MRVVTDPDRLELYDKKYGFEWYKKERVCELVEVEEDDFKVTIKSRYVNRPSLYSPEFRRNTLKKYLCIGGPFATLRKTSVEIVEGYTPYNGTRGGEPRDSNIHVWHELLSSSANG